jgi:hypothetical protein
LAGKNRFRCGRDQPEIGHFLRNEEGGKAREREKQRDHGKKFLVQFLLLCCRFVQGCQMVYSQTKINDLGKFWNAFEWNFWFISWPFGIFYGPFGIFCGHSVLFLPSGIDFIILKIYLPKKSTKIAVFDSKQSLIIQNFDHNIVF